MEKNKHRIRILTDIQIDQIYGIPKFDEEERFLFFSLDEIEKEIIHKLRTPLSKSIFILMLGYFKAKQLFFSLDPDVINADMVHIGERYFQGTIPLQTVSKQTSVNHQRLILDLFGFRFCIKEDRKDLEQKAKTVSSISTKPLYVFYELLSYCRIHGIIAPSYSTLQDIVGKSLAYERNRLESLLFKHTDTELQESLKDLLSKGDQLYQITQLKKDAKDFNYNEILKEIKKCEILEPIYKKAVKLIPKLNVSIESIKYYASLLTYYSHRKLFALNERTSNLYLLCFAYYKYQALCDNLIKALIHHVRHISNEAKEAGHNALIDLKITGNENLEGVSHVLKMYYDATIPDEEEFGKIKMKAYQFLDKDKIPFMAEFISNSAIDKEEIEWQQNEKLVDKYKKNIRPIIKILDFDSNNKRDSLIAAVNALKKAFLAKQSLKSSIQYFNIKIIPPKKRKYFYTAVGKNKHGKHQKLLNPDRYEIFVYEQLAKSIDEDEVFCKQSASYKSLEDDLIEKSYWNRNMKKILEKLDTPRLLQPAQEILKICKNELEPLIFGVNERIINGTNKYIKLKGKAENRTWSLIYKKDEEQFNQSMFSQLKPISICQLLSTINDECLFSEEFTHILETDVRSEVNIDVLIAAIIAMATNTGLNKMAEVSDISYQELSSIFKRCFRLETLRKASDRIINKIANMEIFRDYNIEEGLIYSSSDGQKYEVKIPTINARYSPKYFGMKRGVSSIGAIANHVPFNMTLVSSNEHESYFVYDILANNTSEISPDIHTTDTHGSNRANFILLHMSEYKYAPRLRDIKRRTKNLYGFCSRSKYKNLLIAPSRKVKQQLIIDEWNNALRIFASLALKTTTQSTIVRKLCAQKGYTKTKQAIWELNDILESIHIYEFIDDPQMRQNIHKALNRGEAYNKLSRAIADVGGGRFKFRTEMEQKIGMECNRLIANAIIYYNLKLLTYLKENAKTMGIEDIEKLVKKTSPVAWSHINLQGQYQFRGATSVKFDEIFEDLKHIKTVKN